MLIDAAILTHLQACSRRFLLETDYAVIHWRAKMLFDACLRVGVRQVSEGMKGGDAAKEMSARFMQEAANPGLDLPHGSNSYRIAKDYCAMLGTILRAAERWQLPRLSDPVPVPFAEHEWRPLAFESAGGELHRIVTCERWDAREMARELHSWYVFGDIVATGREMVIHAVDVGRTRDSRRHSVWARGWKQPGMPNLKMHFASPTGKDLKGWKPLWLSDYPHSNLDVWVAQMFEEGVAQAAVHEVRVSVPAEVVCMDTRRQMEIEASRAAGLGGFKWSEVPMSRGACDDRIAPCPWQHACHEPVNRLEDTGLYMIRNRDSIQVGKSLVA